MHARARVQERIRLSVWPGPMRWSVAKPQSQLRTVGLGCHPHLPCTAAAPHPSLQSSACLQLEQIAATGNAAEKALLADVTEKNADASYVELLRLFKVRRSVAELQ